MMHLVTNLLNTKQQAIYICGLLPHKKKFEKCLKIRHQNFLKSDFPIPNLDYGQKNYIT